MEITGEMVDIEGAETLLTLTTKEKESLKSPFALEQATHVIKVYNENRSRSTIWIPAVAEANGWLSWRKKKLGTMKRMRMHRTGVIRRADEKKKRRLTCNICGFVALTPKGLKIHMKKPGNTHNLGMRNKAQRAIMRYARNARAKRSGQQEKLQTKKLIVKTKRL